MGNRAITVDTHALVWHLDKGQKKKLSAAALKAIVRAELYDVVYVPAIAIMETVRIIEKGRFSLAPGQDSRQQAMYLLSMIETNPAYQIVPVEANLIRAAIPFTGLKIHDRLIAATALLTGSVLVSKDTQITATGLRVVW